MRRSWIYSGVGSFLVTFILLLTILFPVFDPKNSFASAASSVKYAGSGAEDEESALSPWVNPTNIYSDNAAYAVSTSTSTTLAKNSGILHAYNFGFSSVIAAGDTITGIVVTIDRKASAASKVHVVSLYLTNSANATVGVDNSDDATYFGTSDATESYPINDSTTYLWSAGLTTADVRSNAFGVQIGCHLHANTPAVSASIDYVTITVYYTPAVVVTWRTVQTVTGLIRNTTSFKTIKTIGGTILNTTGFKTVQTINGGIHNTTVWKTVQTINGVILNASGFRTVQTITGAITNTTGWRTQQTITGTILNTTGFRTMQTITGAITNTTGWRTIKTINGSIYNVSEVDKRCNFIQMTDTHIMPTNVSANPAPILVDGRMDDLGKSNVDRIAGLKTKYQYSVGINSSKFPILALNNTVDYINDNDDDVDFVVVTGDIIATQNTGGASINARLNSLNLVNRSLSDLEMPFYCSFAFWHDQIDDATNRAVIEDIFDQDSHLNFTVNGNLFIVLSEETGLDEDHPVALEYLNSTLKYYAGLDYNAFVFYHTPFTDELYRGVDYPDGMGCLEYHIGNYTYIVQMCGHGHKNDYAKVNGIYYVETTAMMNYPIEYRRIDVTNDTIHIYDVTPTGVDLTDLNDDAYDVMYDIDSSYPDFFSGDTEERNIWIPDNYDWRTVQTITGEIENVSVPVWTTTQTIVGTVLNTTAFKTVQTISGTILNTTGFKTTQTLQGSIFNTTGFKTIQTITGTILNTTGFRTIQTISGEILNISGFKTVQTISGAIQNTTAFKTTQTLTGTILNTTGFKTIQTISGDILNTTAWKTIQTINGTIQNISETHWYTTQTLTGIIQNTTTFRTMQTISGAILNTTAWKTKQMITGAILNATNWRTSLTINGDIYNVSGFRTVQTIDGEIINISTMDWYTLQTISGSIQNISSFKTTQTIQGAILNTSAFKTTQTLTGAILNTTSFETIQTITGVLVNGSWRTTQTIDGVLINTSLINISILSYQPLDNATGVCPCDVMCVWINATDRVNMTVHRKSESETVYYLVANYTNISAAEYCFVLEGHIDGGVFIPFYFNETYEWYAYIEYYNDTTLNYTSPVYNFTTAVDSALCPCGGGGGGSNNNGRIGIIGLCGILGIVFWFIWKKKRKNQ